MPKWYEMVKRLGNPGLRSRSVLTLSFHELICTPAVCGFHRPDQCLDTVSRSGLYNILKLLGCPETLLSILVAFHENMKARVQFDGSMSKTFPICRGVKQGCVLAPTLFGIFFSALFAHAFPQEDGIMLQTRSTDGLFNLSWLRVKTKTKHVLIRELLYADDAALVAHSEMHLQNLCERFAKACNDFSMTINLNKTVVMSLRTSSPPRILINGSPLNVVDKFSYLGSIVLSTLQTIWTMKSTNELERLRLTSDDFVLGFGKITTSQSN